MASWRARVRIEWSGSEPWQGKLCCVLGQDILLFGNQFSPWAMVVFEQYGQQTLTIVVENLTLTAPLSTQVYKWVPGNLMLWGNPAMN